jgi:hypothetical protein
MSDLVVTVAVSALTSGVVALGIEYVAKPRLEARKEELLELHRRRRELKAMLLKIMTLSAMWGPYAARGASELDSEMARAREHLDSMTRQLWDDIEWYAGSFPSLTVRGQPPARDLVIKYIFSARAVFLSDLPEAEKLRILGEITEPLQVGLSNRWPGTRARAFVKLPAVLDKYAPAPGSTKPEQATASAGETGKADDPNM